ncbi:MAG TPA: cupin domain-containing protein [Acidimicrobiales bacterium]|nr:cupin domain-containing protein [Acidimicrobiales bacterium]
MGDDVDELIAAAAAEGKLLVDPYARWAEVQGVPVVEDFGVDLLSVETAHWDLLGVPGALVHLQGRGDYVNVVVTELPPGGATDSQRHLYEEVVYVLSGHGSTTVERSDGRQHTFEWGTRSVFGLPLNARYRHFNSSGSEPARLASVTSLPLVMKVFRQQRFIFDNPWGFEERFGDDQRFQGEGDFIGVAPGRHMWETNFVPDLANFDLPAWAARGARSRNLKLVLADATMHAHVSEMPVGTYKKAHRHGPDFHVFTVIGHGYSLLWYEGDEDYQRIDWRHGVVYAPPDQMFHQHFNTAPEPVRYLAVAYGGLRYPFTEERHRHFLGVDKGLKEGGRQIDYADEDPRIRQLYLERLAEVGVESTMDPPGTVTAGSHAR